MGVYQKLDSPEVDHMFEEEQENADFENKQNLDTLEDSSQTEVPAEDSVATTAQDEVQEVTMEDHNWNEEQEDNETEETPSLFAATKKKAKRKRVTKKKTKKKVAKKKVTK